MFFHHWRCFASPEILGGGGGGSTVPEAFLEQEEGKKALVVMFFFAFSILSFLLLFTGSEYASF